ncbi:MAG: CCA tRNA nucleotidyltransferase [Thermodesulfobacteriota bacterium]
MERASASVVAPPRDPAARRKYDVAAGVVRKLREAGREAVLAGGCVRDLLLGVEPADYDVATSASADEVQHLFRRTVPVGVQFGVVLVLEDGEQMQVATFRRDGAYLDHRHPVEVHFADERADAQRRDFTINGMFLDPETGDVRDHVGGREDLAAGIIRAIGDPYARFDEDRLRLLRAVRFAARFDYRIEDATWRALRRLAPTIVGIAWERIGDEIVKILTEGRARRGFELLSESGLLGVLLPEVEAMRGVAQSADHHPEGDVFTHTMLCLEKLTPAHGEALALAVLLHDVGKPLSTTHQEDGRITFYGHCEKGAEMTRDVVQRLRRSRDTAERAAVLVEQHLRHVQAPAMRVATLKRFLAQPHIDDLLELTRIDALSASGDLEAYAFCRARQAELAREVRLPDPLLRGRDLIELGHRPGPRFREILERAFDAQLEGEITSHEAARAWVMGHYPPAGADGAT